MTLYRIRLDDAARARPPALPGAEPLERTATEESGRRRERVIASNIDYLRLCPAIHEAMKAAHSHESISIVGRNGEFTRYDISVGSGASGGERIGPAILANDLGYSDEQAGLLLKVMSRVQCGHPRPIPALMLIPAETGKGLAYTPFLDYKTV